MTAPVIRPAVAADTGAIAALKRRAYARFVPRLGRAPQPLDADCAALIAADKVWALEEADGRIAGALVLVPGARHLLIWSVAIDPDLQGRGHGRRLMAFAEAEARRLGLDAVELYTNELMAENVAFYAALGYAETERRPYRGSTLVYMRKCVYMRKRVGGP